MIKEYRVQRHRIRADGTVHISTHIVRHELKTERKKPEITDEIRQKIHADIAYGCQKKLIAQRYGFSTYHLQKILSGTL